ncbi:ATP-binding protein [Clostridium sardiniense]|uniref:ATP-binding protein n=1 Tax=Clostridium sardiniense TaxID=29369 RepID=UPI001FD4C9A8|nr:ATP-binding protein [Clostridium sardiniense]MDQ0460364.1 DNA replication protein DnaC [Clostridium sardiniense]
MNSKKHQQTSEVIQKRKSNEQELSKCLLCDGLGFIYDEESNKYSKCKCRENENLINSLAKTGLSGEQLKRSFKDFIPWNEETKKMKDIATSYYLSFDKIKKSQSNSLALLGESGSGKTHLISALINNFILNKSIDIAYMSYIDSVTELKQNILNAEVYQRKVSRYKTAQILVIDDLFKGGYTDSDIRIVLEIINHRYSARLPIMVSSEFFIDDLIKIDKALGGRVREMSKGYIYEIKGIENNYRLNH